ncbi:MAG TPA: MarR family transcriptional regulator [Phycisphaerae bacterium]|jgi:DNA-binding MarR family transcriptional regulator|nr:MarR family transcriptional regulator [Phycisphaerae bacterium]
MAKQMYALRDVPRYENIRAAAARYPELEAASGAAFVMLLRVASDMLAATDAYLEEHKLSQGRFVVMMLLYRVIETPQNPCTLAEKAGVTRASMTGLLDGLEREGHVARETAAKDRRMMDVSLTPRGKKYLESVMPGYFRLVRKAMGGLSTAEKEQLIGLLTKLGATSGISTMAPNDAK